MSTLISTADQASVEMQSAESRVNPAVLVVTTDRWYPTARLVMALAKAGCTVDVVCPSGHPVSNTHAPRRIHDYNGLMPLRSLERAIAAASPDVIVPGDDLATRHLHELHKREQARPRHQSRICQLIERSLGAAQSFGIVNQRCAFMQLAEEEGVRVPKMRVIHSLGELRTWAVETGFPFVLKANGTSGGDGVKVVNSLEEADHAFRKLQAPPLLARAAKHALIDRDLTLLWPSISRQRRVVNAQTFVDGYEATSAIVCWEGRVLASLHFEVAEKVGATGHATVVRMIEHPEMSSAAEKIAKRLALSGFHGLDFMLEARTGHAYLIEINPRTTQVGHLALGSGRDLPAALYGALTGKTAEPAAKVTESDTIALFPQEWKRDAESPYLSSGYHDVPWEEPALISAAVSKLPKRSSKSAGVMLDARLAANQSAAQVSASSSQKSA
jgi:hypothetical protein